MFVIKRKRVNYYLAPRKNDFDSFSSDLNGAEKFDTHLDAIRRIVEVYPTGNYEVGLRIVPVEKTTVAEVLVDTENHSELLNLQSGQLANSKCMFAIKRDNDGDCYEYMTSPGWYAKTLSKDWLFETHRDALKAVVNAYTRSSNLDKGLRLVQVLVCPGVDSWVDTELKGSEVKKAV